MELATVNDENPCVNRGLVPVCQPRSLAGTKDKIWRRRKSNPQVQSRNSEVAQRLWNMLQDVGVSWEWKDDVNRQPLALGHEELAEVIIASLLRSADLKQAILTWTHVRELRNVTRESCLRSPCRFEESRS